MSSWTASYRKVRGADVVGGEDGVEAGLGGSGDFGEGALDVGAATLFAVDEAEDGGDGHAGFAGCFDGGDSAGAGGADVVDDDGASALAEETFDAAAGAVGLLGLADEKAVDERGAVVV